MSLTLNPLIGLVLGYLALILASTRGASAQLSIASMIVVYMVVSATMQDILVSLARLASWNDIRVFVFIAFSLFIAGVMRETGVLKLMVSAVESLSCRAASVVVPALVGLLPMPGGALVSAMAVSDLYERAKLKPHWKVYLNYWFRHIWVPSWPLFQSVLITAAVLAVDPLLIVSVTWPATIAAITAGGLVSAPLLRRIECPSRRLDSSSLKSLMWSTWPFMVIALLATLTPIGLLGALTITALLVVGMYRPSLGQLLAALRFALSPRIHLVLFEALYFKELLLLTNAPKALALAASNLPIALTVYIVPFILGLGAGGENFFAATAMPLLKNYIVTGSGINHPLLLLAYLGGYLGVMASPVHLCFALTVDYFHASPAKSMLPVIASIILTTLIVSIPLLLVG